MGRFSSKVWIILGFAFLAGQVSTGAPGAHAENGWKKKEARVRKSAIKHLEKEELVQIGQKLRQLLPVRYETLRKNGTSRLGEFLRGRKQAPIDLRAAVDQATLLQQWDVVRDVRRGVPRFLRIKEKAGGFRKAGNVAAVDLAREFLSKNRRLFRLENPDEELVVRDETVDRFGWRHVRFQQIYKGIPVWKSELVAHVNREDGLYAINARYLPTPRQIDPGKLAVSREKAVRLAVQNLGLTEQDLKLPEWQKRLLNYDGPQATLYIWQDDEAGISEPRLVWHVSVRPNFKDNWYAFVDARTGEVLQRYNATAFDGPVTASGVDLNGQTRSLNVYLHNGTYYMIDATRPIWQAQQPDLINSPKGALVTVDVRGKDLASKTTIYHVTSTNNTWPDPVSVSAHYNMGEVFDYYYSNFGRLAIDGKGSTIYSVIHVTEDGKPMDNAYWNGVAMAYGDGNVLFKPLAGALDVAAHEMTHGVIEHTVGLEYKFQSGALNESLADVFGVMVDDDDWTLGEEVTKAGYFPSGALRSMADPHNGASQGQNGWQPAHMNEFVNLDINTDNGGVHINSGIPNHACYLIGKAIGRKKTEKLYYRTMDAKYLTAQSQFIDMRLALIRAAEDFVQKGEMSQSDVDAVKAAFDQVGITGEQGTPPPQDLPPVQGQQWIAAINAEFSDHSLYLLRPVIQSNDDIVQLTSTQVYTESSNPISVTEDGSLLLFVDQNNYIRAIYGGQEQVITRSGVWSSIALSPNSNWLAATTIYQDSVIYVINLNDPNQSKAVRLYAPTTDGARSYTVLFADALDWNHSSEFLLFDAFNSIPQMSGDSLKYWNINLMDVQHELIYPVFPPQPEGISVGNPSFSQLNDNYIVFDFYDFNKMQDVILAYDIFNSQLGAVESNGSYISYARYSTDDQFLIFERGDGFGGTNLRMVQLKSNKIEAASQSVGYVTGGMRPFWFAMGTRTAVENHAPAALPERFSVAPNYPNPFNPETRIRFDLPFAADVTVEVLDLQGRHVATLLAERKSPGTHQVNWNGRSDRGEVMPSGVYFYRVTAREKSGRQYRSVRKMMLLK